MTDTLQPRQSLTDRVTTALVTEIMSGVFEPGMRLPSGSELTKRFGVSLSVIRESISRLKADGLVDTRQGSGAYVGNPSSLRHFRIDASPSRERAAVRDIYEIRVGIESEAVTFAALRRTETHVATMRKVLGKIDERVGRGERAIEPDFELHRTIAEASGNELFVNLIGYLNSQIIPAMQRSQSDAAHGAEHAAGVRREHWAIVEAIENGDGESARLFMRRHIHNCMKRALTTFNIQQG